MMTELLEAVTFWPNMILVVVVFGFAPGFCLRLIVLAYPRSDPRRDELIAELYAVPGLVNKAMVNQRLAQVFTKRAGQRRIGVCFLDLDEFQAVNDNLGKDAGDQLLKAVASRLTRCCTSGQLVARTGGDEFAIIVEDATGEHDVAVLAEKILTAMTAPIRVDDHKLTVTMSIGIVERPVADTNLTDLLQAADIALYRVKGDGKRCYTMFDRLAGGDVDRPDRHARTDAQSPRTPGLMTWNWSELPGPLTSGASSTRRYERTAAAQFPVASPGGRDAKCVCADQVRRAARSTVSRRRRPVNTR